MRIFRLLPLLMLLTLTCATTGASTLTETSYITQPKPKHHKKPHHKAPPHKKPHHKKRPAPPPHGRRRE